MNDFYNCEYLLIDKMEDFHYFKNLQEVADYLNITKTKATGIHFWCKRNYTRQPSTGLFIQRLYNNPTLKQSKNDVFHWDEYKRKAHKKAIDYKNYNNLNLYNNI